MDDVTPSPHSSGFLDAIGGNCKYRPPINSSGGEDAFFGALTAGRSAGRFWHTDNIEHKKRTSDFGLWTLGLEWWK